MSTFKPQLVGLPAALIRPGRNEIAIRLESAKIYTLGVSRMEIGPETAIRKIYNWRYITQFQGVLVSNSMLHPRPSLRSCWCGCGVGRTPRWAGWRCSAVFGSSVTCATTMKRRRFRSTYTGMCRSTSSSR
jgi:hypothetical protein